MLEQLLGGLFDTSMTQVIGLGDFLLCIACALFIGLLLSGCYMYRTRYTRSFVATLALLPAVVCVVIMMVNGNVGAGVAVARSLQPGSIPFRTGYRQGNRRQSFWQWVRG